MALDVFPAQTCKPWLAPTVVELTGGEAAEARRRFADMPPPVVGDYMRVFAPNGTELPELPLCVSGPIDGGKFVRVDGFDAAVPLAQLETLWTADQRAEFEALHGRRGAAVGAVQEASARSPAETRT